MSGILLLIPTIIIGYFFKKKHFYLNYKFSKLNGHHLYFASAAFGFLFVFIATIIYFIIVNIYISIFCYFSDNYVLTINFFRSVRSIFSEINFSINVFFIYSIAVIIAWLVSMYDKRAINSVTDIHNPLIFGIISEDPTDRLLNISANSDSEETIEQQDRIIMLTMNDRKVYIGLVSESRKELFGRFSQGSSDFEFMPLMSGYRDKDTLDLVITTDYSEAIQSNLNITVILNKSEISTLTKVNSEQLSKFLLSGNILHREILRSYSKGEKIIVKDKDNKYLLGVVSSSEYLNERLLKKYPYFYFEVVKNSENIEQIRVLLSIDNVKEVYSAENIEEIFEKLNNKKPL